MDFAGRRAQDAAGVRDRGAIDTMSKDIARLFHSLTHGVYIIGVADGGRVNAFTAACVMLASFDPPHLAVAVNAHHSSYRMLKASGSFSVNVLKRTQMAFAQNFAGPASAEKMAFAAWSTARTGAPLLTDALAWFECRLAGELPAGTHTLVLGRVINGSLLDSGAEPLNYREVTALDEEYAASAFPDRLEA
jgi:flavin reductase (DIM6/NTAB) family NADH-FMN oxidoreductase RutF